MLSRHRTLYVFTGIALFGLVVWSIASCGGGGGGGGSATPVTTKGAAASSSAAMGSVQLSATIGQASSMASGAIPAGYAPGKTARRDTSAIANIDPRLKVAVDKMMAKIEKPMIRNAVSKSSLSKLYSAPIATVSDVCVFSGTYQIVVNSVVTVGTTTTNSIDVTYTNCKDTLIEEIHGTLSAIHSFDTVASSETSTVAMNLTFKDYDATGISMNSISVISGDFNSSITGTANASGSNFANGLFSFTTPTVNGTTMAFTFTNVTDVWSKATTALGTTEQHTGNGAFALSIKDNAAGTTIMSLTTTLTNLVDKVFTDTNATYQDEWVNGTVNISWVPDLSQYGCSGGNYVFTTAVGTPLHTPAPFATSCPTSGTATVNSATIEFGKPAGVQVTVTVGGASETFVDCDSLGSGMCG
jgi:hypothetical protein